MPVIRKALAFLDRLAEFTVALVHHWLAFVGGSVLTAVVLSLYERIFRSIPLPYYLGILFAVGLLVAAYRAWSEEHTRRLDAEEKLTQRGQGPRMFDFAGATIEGSQISDNQMVFGGTNASRRLRPEQHAAITNTLLHMLPEPERAQRYVSVVSVGAERETRAYAEDFAAALTAGGIRADVTIEADFHIPFTKRYLRGIHVRRTDDKSPRTDLILGNALRAANIEFTPVPDPPDESGAVSTRQPVPLPRPGQAGAVKSVILPLGVFSAPVQLLIGEP